MTFFLGSHRAHWLAWINVPLFVSRRQLCCRKSFPRAIAPWALDSGGFTEIAAYGRWTITARQYAAEVRRYAQEVGNMQWASVADWMCEPAMLQRTGLSVPEHQRLSLLSYQELRALAPEIHWAPALQGWRVEDYLEHVEMYAAAGIDLRQLPVVGLGSVCRRQHMREAERIVRALPGIRLHGYGFKTTGLERVADAMVSADSLAWSAGARHRPPLPGCPHRNCANCARYALQWRERLLARLAAASQRGRQLTLWV